jgi:hypothetical protein
MTLDDFKKFIDELVTKGHGKKTVVFASDEEGNSYSDVFYAPSVVNVKDIANVYNGKGKGKVVAVC